jgi:heme-degrading monooxygenase HmoA
MIFKEDSIETFRQLFNSRKELIRHFEGCQHLELWQDKTHPYIFFTYSLWQSEDALNNYRQSHFFDDTWLQTKQLFAGKPEAWSVQQQVVMQ